MLGHLEPGKLGVVVFQLLSTLPTHLLENSLVVAERGPILSHTSRRNLEQLEDSLAEHHLREHGSVDAIAQLLQVFVRAARFPWNIEDTLVYHAGEAGIRAVAVKQRVHLVLEVGGSRLAKHHVFGGTDS